MDRRGRKDQVGSVRQTERRGVGDGKCVTVQGGESGVRRKSTDNDGTHNSYYRFTHRGRVQREELKSALIV